MTERAEHAERIDNLGRQFETLQLVNNQMLQQIHELEELNAEKNAKI